MFSIIKQFYEDNCLDCTTWLENDGIDPKYPGKRSVCVSRGCPKEFLDLVDFLRIFMSEIENGRKK